MTEEPWPAWFEVIMRQQLTNLDDTHPLQADQPLSTYGLTSLGCLRLAEHLAQRCGIAAHRLLPASFRTAGAMWASVASAQSTVESTAPRQGPTATTTQPAEGPAITVAAPRTSTAPAQRAPGVDRDPGDSTLTLARRFEASASAHPEASCVVLDDTSVTYRQMDDEARRLASYLLAHHSRAGTDDEPAEPLERVAVLAERDVLGFQAYLAPLYAGATVIPLSLDSPPSRNAAVVLQARAQTVLIAADTDDAWVAQQVAALSSAPASTPERPLLVRTGAVPEGSTPAGQGPMAPNDPDTMAYLLFTSGSTGQPKGVGVTHRNVGHFLEATMPCYDVGPDDVFSQAHELTFDLSVFEVWGAWVSGAAVAPVSRAQALDPGPTSTTRGVTVWTCTPSLMATAARSAHLPPGSMPTVRYLVFCGERLPWTVALAARTAAPNAMLDNNYGPTEATVWCMHHRLGGECTHREGAAGGAAPVPIGRPCPGTEVLLLPLEDAPDGSREICLAGGQVVNGYLDPSLDAERFLDLAGRRWYRTGDLGHQDADGVLHHLGRYDDQAKVNGYRVELGELETVAAQCLGGMRTAAIGVGDDAAVQLVLFVEAATDQHGDGLRSQLAEVLPPYLLPRQVIVVPQLPLTANGKLDRGALARNALQQRR